MPAEKVRSHAASDDLLRIILRGSDDPRWILCAFVQLLASSRFYSVLSAHTAAGLMDVARPDVQP